MRIRQRDDLPAVARVGEDFLVAGERGVEDHLAGRRAGRADRSAHEHRAVGEGQEGLGVVGQQLRGQGTAPSGARGRRGGGRPRNRRGAASRAAATTGVRRRLKRRNCSRPARARAARARRRRLERPLRTKSAASAIRRPSGGRRGPRRRGN